MTKVHTTKIIKNKLYDVILILVSLLTPSVTPSQFIPVIKIGRQINRLTAIKPLLVMTETILVEN